MSPLKRRASVVCLTVLTVLSPISAICPSACVCKWKSGKQSVECKGQGLAMVPAELDTATQVLDLTGNNLQELPKHVFANKSLTNLQKIYLGDCKIGRIDPTAFHHLTNLVELDLSENLLTEVPSTAFSNTPALRWLYLMGNQIRNIHDDSFLHSTSLVRLDLSYAGIRSIAPHAFHSLSLLEQLSLQGNHLQELPHPVVGKLETIHSLEVYDNKWMCDCRALPLWRLLEVKNIPHSISPTCATPSRVKGRSFTSLVQNDFACPPEILAGQRTVEGIAGNNATISCPVGGQPPPQVTWYLGDSPVVNGSVVGLGPQRMYVITNEGDNHVSRLVITGAQETDSGTLRCVAQNSAGYATANFTLAVTMRAAEPAELGSSHIAGISAGLVVLFLILIIAGFLLLARFRTTQSPIPVKDPSVTPSPATASPCEPNPVQKPPRLTDLNGGSPAGFGMSQINNPDIVSEAERAVRGKTNGHLPNGSAHGVSDEPHTGDYTRVEGDSLYPSGLWPEDAPTAAFDNPDTTQSIHEHFNPGYMVQDQHDNYSTYGGYGPVHSTPYRPGMNPMNSELRGEFDPQEMGYPSDYGLPIPERTENSRLPGSDSSMADGQGSNADPLASRSEIYASRQEMYQSQQDIYATRQEALAASRDLGLYGTIGRPPTYGHRQDIYDSRLDMPEGGAESPTGPTGPPGERPWVPGSQTPCLRGVAHGVPVLPPLPNGFAQRIKARDSPDEGYQEGTEV
ncbi:unnamed protein product, partial [Meganyctiphanes norvegica]